jgi:hypothetical protein
MKIELLYDRECPNVSATRANLSQALRSANLPENWTEWEQSSVDVPAHARRFGSPTLLIDGRDVAGVAASAETSCCRLYSSITSRMTGVPDVSLIQAALVQQMVESGVIDIAKAALKG